MLEKTLESSLNSKEIKLINPKGNQPWTFTGRTAAEAELPILWSPDVKSQLTGKDSDAGKDWGQEEKGVTHDKKVGWHHQLKQQELEQTLGDNEGQGSLACYSLWGCKGSDATQWLNNKGIAHLGFLWGLNKTIMKQYSTVSGKWVKAIRSIFFITATISANIWANYFTSLGSVSIPLKR